jgi:hypothetical protein
MEQASRKLCRHFAHVLSDAAMRASPGMMHAVHQVEPGFMFDAWSLSFSSRKITRRALLC